MEKLFCESKNISVEQMLNFLKTIDKQEYKKFLVLVYNGIGTVKELVKYLNLKHQVTANNFAGQLGNKMKKFFDLDKTISPYLTIFSGEYISKDEKQQYFWSMEENLKRAVEIIGWNVEYKSIMDLNSLENEKNDILTEGKRKEVHSKRYERNTKARKVCLDTKGYSCVVCDFNFSRFYGGQIGGNYIQVHHIAPLSVVKKECVVDPVKDLVPICANCHTILHKNNISHVELKKILDELKS